LCGGVGKEFKFHLASCSKTFTLFYLDDLGIRSLIFLTELSWENGFGVSTLRGSLYGDRQKLNMTRRGEGGVTMQLLGSVGLGCGKTLGGAWDFSRFVRFEVRDGPKIRFCHDV
jgi:hypothetical protein